MEAHDDQLLFNIEPKSETNQVVLREGHPQQRMFPNNGYEHDQVQFKYYEEFRKIYHTSYKLHTEIAKQVKSKETLTSRISQIENQLAALHKTKKQEIQELEQENSNSSKRKASKRTRRTAQEIERKFYCKAEFCDRCYGSQGSLQQHIKLKHPELYKNENYIDDLQL